MILALLEPYLKKYFSAVCLYRLWIVLLLGLFLPMRAADMNALFYISLPRITVEDKAANDDSMLGNESSMNLTQIQPQKLLTQDEGDINSSPQGSHNSVLKRFLSAITNRAVQSGYIFFGMLWCVGFIILTKKGIVYYRYLKHLKRFMSPLDQKEFTEVHQQCLLELQRNNGRGHSRVNKAKICKCSVIKSPMTIGILRQVILLPNEEYTNREFYFAIRHELIHIQRRDSVIKLIRLIVLSLYWYNPLCYLLSRHLDEWCEASCDELVLQNSTRLDCLCYGKLLLKCATSQENRAFTVSMIEERNI
jgi:beta-lactamase regulating signal transducer with metallopeptidase domain